MMTECGVCGKHIVIPYPEFYVYKREGTYFCSLDCMVVFKTQLTRQRCGFKTERTDKEMKQHKLTQEQKKQAVQIAIQGGDPLEYLKKSGAKNPSAAWWYIRKTLSEADPEKYRELTVALATLKPEKEIEWQHDDQQFVAKVVKKEETAGGLEVTIEKTDKLPPEAQNMPAQRKVVHHKEPITPDHPERATNMENLEVAKKAEREDIAGAAMKATAAVQKLCKAINSGKHLEYKVIGIETKLGKFQYDHASDQLRWMPRRTTVVIMMPAAEWKKLAEDLPKIMKKIGAEDREDDEDGEE